MHIAIISGGNNSEREISLLSGKNVLRELEQEGHDTQLYDFPLQQSLLTANKTEISFAYIMLHGSGGEDGEVSELLDRLGIPYQGATPEQHALCIDKYATKQVRKQQHLPVASDILIDMKHLNKDTFVQQLTDFGLPCVCKALYEGSTKGMAFCLDTGDLGTARDQLKDYDSILVEAYISGREFTVSILDMPNGETLALPIIEIIPPVDELFDYDNKYNGRTQEICPAQISDELTQQIKSLALQAYTAVGCTGYGRVDILMDEHGLYLLEINTIPGFTAQSLFPRASQAAGIPFPKLLEILRTTGQSR